MDEENGQDDDDDAVEANSQVDTRMCNSMQIAIHVSVFT